jgi:hypothetical protein
MLGEIRALEEHDVLIGAPRATTASQIRISASPQPWSWSGSSDASRPVAQTVQARSL